MKKLPHLPLIPLVILLALSLAQEASAARRIHFQIELDGHVVLDAGATAADRTPTPQIWAGLQRRGHETFKAQGGYVVEANAEDPLVATLRGDIYLQVKWGDRILAEAATPTLRLVRDGPGATEWFVAPDEVERTAKLAGLPPPSTMPTPQAYARSVGRILALALLACLVVIIVLLVILARSGGGETPPDET